MMGKIWPRTAKKQEDIGPVTDLDAIIAESVPFRFNGKIHKIKPIDLEGFLKFTNAQINLRKKADDGELLDANTLAKNYHLVITAVCDTVTLDDIKSMSQVQIAALYQLVLDAITGQVESVEDDGTVKKKRMKNPIYDIARQTSSKSVPPISDGHQDKL